LDLVLELYLFRPYTKKFAKKNEPKKQVYASDVEFFLKMPTE